jgi:oligopeptide transport system ATP-binding protein
MEDNLLLSVQDLKVYFRGDETVARALDGVSYDIYKGETVCLVGESGCGKTVSALTILGLIPRPPGEIAGGRILFEGKNLLEFGEEEMQKVRGGRIAMVFQEPMTSLNPVFTIGDQIKEAILVHESIEEAELHERCLQLLRDVGIPSPEERVKDYPHQLSGGQRQRVMIAMALACNPDLVIADEPTTALDVTTEAQILDLMRALQAELGMAIMYITHNLGVVAEMSQEVAVMYLGKIVEQTGVQTIFFRPQHPYTQGLLQSIPQLDDALARGRAGKRLQTIKGMVPDPYTRLTGCTFHPRCPEFMAGVCDQQEPPIVETEPGHIVRCHLYAN